ncbi:MAG: MFS transporter [bacterium]|nr:MAG: MFS transporter [bacterium]
MPDKGVKGNHINSLYLTAALGMIFMTLIVAIQPLYLSEALGLTRGNAGFINANIQVVTEIVNLFAIGYIGYISDRYGRVPVMVGGFLLAGVTALIVPFSHVIGLWLGLGGLMVFYLVRILISLGTVAVWPQIAALAGDFSNRKTRPRLIANAGLMMAFGATLSYAVLIQIPQHAGLTLTILLGAVIAFAGAWIAKKHLIDVAEKLEEKKIPLRRIMELLKKEKGLRLTFLSAFTSRNDMIIVGLFLMIWFIYFADLLAINHAEAAARAGLVIGFIGLVALVSMPTWGTVMEKYGRVPAIAAGLAVSGIGFVSFGFIVNPFTWQIFIPAVLVGIGQAGCLLAPQTLTIDIAPENIRGSVLGAFNTAGCLGVIIFLQASGFLFDRIGPPAPFLLTGMANLMVMGYALMILKSKRRDAVDDSSGGFADNVLAVAGINERPAA